MTTNPTASVAPVPVTTVQPNISQRASARGMTRAQEQGTAMPSDKQTADGKQEKGFSFWDLVDIVNPLQHIPIVNTIYREVTGDQISGFARIAGGALFGGVIGAGLGAANAVVAQDKGEDIGALALHKMGLGHARAQEALPPVQVANTTPEVKPTKNIPLIEVRPVTKEWAFELTNKNLQADITWDAPSSTALPEKPAALPETKELAQLDKHQIPSKMMEALQKYQAMQSMNNSTVVATPATN